MKYSQYNTEDFIADEEFKNWVISPTHESDQFWKKWIGSNPHKRETIAEAKEMILSMKFNETYPGNDLYESVLSNVLSEEENDFFRRELDADLDKHPQHRDMSNRLFFLKIASTVVLFLVTGLLFFYLNGTFEAEESKVDLITKKIDVGRRTIELPDGSYVKLNSRSSITYPEKFSDTLRSVKLNGEAFFDVKSNKNKPFVVNTPYLDINVLGTTFNVRSYKEENNVNISLASGKVLVNRFGNTRDDVSQEFYLLPGEKCVFNRYTNEIHKTGFQPEIEYGWKDGILIFNDADLDEFVKTLEHWYGVQFDVVGEKQGNWHIEGRFENESLREVLEGLSFTYNIKYDLNLENNMVTLYI